MTSLTVAVIPKIIVLILLVCLTRAAAGSCLSYGHSCWGGHGKRSASPHYISNPSNNEKSDEWFFSKLVKFLKERPIELPNVYKSHIQDSSTFDKFIKNAYQKYPFTDSAESMATRNQEAAVDEADASQRDASDSILGDAETFYEPEEDDLMWNSKLQAYQKIVLREKEELDNITEAESNGLKYNRQ